MGHLDLLKLYEPHFPSCLARKQSNWRPKKEHQGQRPLEDMWMLATKIANPKCQGGCFSLGVHLCPIIPLYTFTLYYFELGHTNG